MPFPSGANNPLYVFLRSPSDALKSGDPGYYFFSPGVDKGNKTGLFQGHHLIPVEMFGGNADEDVGKLFQNINQYVGDGHYLLHKSNCCATIGLH